MPQGITRHKTDTKCLIALGSNVASSIGSPEQIVRAALVAISEADSTVICASRLFRTPCIPLGAGPDYVNAAVEVSSPLDAADVLARLQGLEWQFDRKRTSRWAARTLDLDLLDFGGAITPDLETWQHWHDLPFEQQKVLFPDQMILPHPRLQDRAFVLAPLMDIAPEWSHPVTGKTVREMFAELTADDLAGITPL